MEVGDIITFRPIGGPPGRKAGIVLDIDRVSTVGGDSDFDVIRVLLCGTGEIKDILGSQLKDNTSDIW